MNINYKLNILMCCHLPLVATLGGAKVYLETAQTYRYLGHKVDLIGIDEIVGSNQPFMNEDWRVVNYPEKLYEFLQQHAHRYDVVEYESIYLPFSTMGYLKCILVARSVLLDLHMREIKIPRFYGFKAFAGFLLKGLLRNIKLNRKIKQSLLSMSYADFINVPNPSDKKILIKYGVDPKKIIVQPYGLFEERVKQFNHARANNLIKSKRKIIAFIGTFDNRKGAVEFPQIIKGILDNHPNVYFKLLGVLGMFSSKESIHQYIGDEYKNRVQIYEKYTPEQLPELLKDCTFGIFPSYLESFGFGALEMMAMGLPVVGYDSPGVNMLLLKELTVAPGDLKKLFSVFTKLIENEKFAEECRGKCLTRVLSFIYERQENYSINSYKKKLLEKTQSRTK